MRRREFITLFGVVTAAWPDTARAQQSERVRHLGVLLASEENDPRPKAWLSRVTEGLAELGWTDGRNLRMDLRWGGGDDKRIGEYRHGSCVTSNAGPHGDAQLYGR